jgi:hypothetical protein
VELRLGGVGCVLDELDVEGVGRWNNWVLEMSGVGCHLTSVRSELSGVIQEGYLLVKLNVGFHSRSSSAPCLVRQSVVSFVVWRVK